MEQVVWKYREPWSSGDWRPYDNAVNRLLETEYQKGKKAIVSGDSTRIISFTESTDRNHAGNTLYTIKRFVSSTDNGWNRNVPITNPFGNAQRNQVPRQPFPVTTNNPY